MVDMGSTAPGSPTLLLTLCSVATTDCLFPGLSGHTNSLDPAPCTGMCLLALPAAPWEPCIFILLSLTGVWKDFLHTSLPASISPFLSLPTASLCFPKGTIMTITEAAARLSQEVRGLWAMESPTYGNSTPE